MNPNGTFLTSAATSSRTTFTSILAGAASGGLEEGRKKRKALSKPDEEADTRKSPYDPETSMGQGATVESDNTENAFEAREWTERCDDQTSTSAPLGAAAHCGYRQFERPSPSPISPIAAPTELPHPQTNEPGLTPVKALEDDPRVDGLESLNQPEFDPSFVSDGLLVDPSFLTYDTIWPNLYLTDQISMLKADMQAIKDEQLSLKQSFIDTNATLANISCELRALSKSLEGLPGSLFHLIDGRRASTCTEEPITSAEEDDDSLPSLALSGIDGFRERNRLSIFDTI